MAPPFGVCLSGGGFRATCFGLGVLRYLSEAGLLSRLQVVSAVSGGSILAAVLVDRWRQIEAAGFSSAAFVEHVERPLRNSLAAQNFRNRGLLRWAGRRATFRGPTRGAVVIDEIIDSLCETRTVAQLPPCPQAVFTSTDLGTGQAVRISQEFIGLFAYGYAGTPLDLPLGTAVAASAAVPLLFSPLQLDVTELGFDAAPRTLSLTDGGVYDNLGLEWFQGWDRGRPASASRVDDVFVVDASGPLIPRAKPSRGISALTRTRDVMYWTGRATRTRWYVEQLLTGAIDGLHVGIRADPRTGQTPDGQPYQEAAYAGALPSELIGPLSRLRTDLDRFSTQESGLLAYHAYWLMHARMYHLRPHAALRQPEWREFADLTSHEAAALLATLQRGARRRIGWP